jgi:hypothetical protein
VAESRTIKALATIERKNGEEQLRVNLDELVDDRGGVHSYVSARVWYQLNNEWKPTKKGISIRRTEIRDFGLALRAALDAMNAGDKPSPAPTRRAAPSGSHRTGALLEPLEPDPEGLF